MSLESIGILCRGSSMHMAEEYFKDLNQVIIVNRFYEELKHDFVKKILKEKEITHIVCREASAILSPDIYNEYEIKKIVLNVFKKEYINRSFVKRMLDKHAIPSEYLPDLMKLYEKEGGGFPTTGVLSVVYAAKILNVKNIFIAGMDFYQKKYFINQPPTENQKKKGEVMVKYMKNFIETQSDIHFTLLTHSKFEFDSKNLTIING